MMLKEQLAEKGQAVLTVTQLTMLIKGVLEAFDEVVVEGEVSNLRVPPSGHMYFTLKDETSQIRAVIFRSTSVFLTYLPENGQKVVVKGRLTVYERRGEYQVIVDELLPSGLGELQRRFEELKRRLEKEGLFGAHLKKPLPKYPKKIGVITSPTGAAIRDILKVLGRRFPSVPVLIFPVHVQGERAVPEILRALEYMGGRSDIDVIILGRGGGSIEDLWAFNEEAVARAIFNCPIPVVSAVGHEIDYTISDYVADVRAPTPSAAAEMVVRDRSEVMREIREMVRRMAFSVQSKFLAGRERLEFLSRRLRDPRTVVEGFLMRFSELFDRLCLLGSRAVKDRLRSFESALRSLLRCGLPERVFGALDGVLRMERELGRCEERLLNDFSGRFELLYGKLLSLDPKSVMKRGFSIIRKKDGTIVRSSQDLSPGDEVMMEFYKGGAVGRVERLYPPKASS